MDMDQENGEYEEEYEEEEEGGEEGVEEQEGAEVEENGQDGQVEDEQQQEQEQVVQQPTRIYRPPPAPGSDALPEDTFRILIASDIHIGYNENKTMTEHDTYNTFEEILEIANEEQVDFVLLGGDLFHENKPKPACLHRTMDMLRKHCLGPRPVEFEYLGDGEIDFPGQGEVNYYNPNVNISLPVFTVHGNHDDPIGVKRTSAIDHLASAKLLNHFGQWENLNEINIRPVLLRKGQTQLALYGLGSIRDERLHRIMKEGRVKFLRPAEDPDSWFNLFTLHQNRVKHGPTGYIPENFLPEFLNLVVWGHEHECRIMPEQTVDRDIPMYISQPGSTVATSLIQGEAVDKSVGILSIHGKKFKMEQKKLKTVRPFLIDDIYAHDILLDGNMIGRREPGEFIEKYCEAKVAQMLVQSGDKLSGHLKQASEPLIRVRVGYDYESQLFNSMKFSTLFTGQIANDEIVTFKKMRVKRETGGVIDVGDLHQMISDFAEDENHDLGGHVEEIIEQFFLEARKENEQAKMLKILSESGIGQAVRIAAEKSDKEALDTIVEAQMEKTINHLISQKVNEATIDEEIAAFANSRYQRSDLEAAEAQLLLENRVPGTKVKKAGISENDTLPFNSRNQNGNGGVDDDIIIDDDDDDVGRGRGRGKGGRGRPPRGGARSSPRAGPAQTATRGKGARGGRAQAQSNFVQQKLPMKSTRSSVPFYDED